MTIGIADTGLANAGAGPVQSALHAHQLPPRATAFLASGNLYDVACLVIGQLQGRKKW